MLTADGHVLGVFSIFSKLSRKTFDFQQKRRLADFATIATNLLTGHKDSSDGEGSAVIPQNQDLVHQAPANDDRPRKPDRLSCHDFLIPRALNIRKTSQEAALLKLRMAESSDPIVNNGWSLFGRPVNEPTPPSSSDESNQPFHRKNTLCKTMRPLPEVSGTYQRKTSTSVVDGSLDFRPNNLEDVFDDRSRKPRPKDIASKYPTHVATQSELYYEDRQAADYEGTNSAEKPREPFGCPRPESPVIPAMSPNPEETALSFDTSSGVFTQRHSGGSVTRLSMNDHMQLVPEEVEKLHHTRSISASTCQSNSTDSSSISESRLRAGVELEFATRYWAQRFECDVIYTVSFNPLRDGMTKEEIALPGNMKIEYLSSYGQEGPIDLLEFHLDALDRSVPAIYEQHNTGQPGDISSGYMMRVDQGDPNEVLYGRGVLFCAFRKIKSDGSIPKPIVDEAKKLGQAATALREAFMRPAPAATPRHALLLPASPFVAYSAKHSQSSSITSAGNTNTPKSKQKVLNVKHELRLQ